MNDNEENWIVYVIENGNCTYVGISKNPEKRLRQHNKEISGGAKYTTSKSSNWSHVCLISGFLNKTQALQFEWAVKHVKPRNKGGLVNRINKLITILNKNKWTQKSDDATQIPLRVDILNEKVFELFETQSIPKYITYSLVKHNI